MRSDHLRHRTRDLVFFALPALLLVAAAVTLALYLVNPGPPSTFVVSAASPGSPYYRYAERYREVFKRNGVKLMIRESNGSVDNLARLSDEKSGVDAGIVQGGIAPPTAASGLLSLGRIAYEPRLVVRESSRPPLSVVESRQEPA